MNSQVTLNHHTYETITIGDIFSFEREITESIVEQFAELTGDRNPLHMDEAFANTTEFNGRIVHGMLLGSLFSTLVGMLIPGEKCLYISQDLRFRRPLPLGSSIKIQGEVMAKSDATRMIDIKTTVVDDNQQLIVDGLAKVKVRV